MADTDFPIKQQYSFRCSYAENGIIEQLSKKFPAENIKELFFKVGEFSLKPNESNTSTSTADLENALEAEKNAHLEFREKAAQLNHELLECRSYNGKQLEQYNALENDFNSLKTQLENTEKEYFITPNEEQKKRLVIARERLESKFKIKFNDTSHFLEQLIDVVMDDMRLQFAELK